jgi:multiple sugar transport system substrate-binding protein
MPLLYREVVGVNLIGSYSLNSISEKYQQEIDFFPFPQMTKQDDADRGDRVTIEQNEISPIAVLSLTSSSQKIPAAKKLLQFVATPTTQIFLNKSLNTIAPHQNIQYGDKAVNQKVRKTLNNAENLSQFFDRETDFEFARFAKKQLDDFIKHGDIEKVTQLLEAQRLIAFK